MPYNTFSRSFSKNVTQSDACMHCWDRTTFARLPSLTSSLSHPHRSSPVGTKRKQRPCSPHSSSQLPPFFFFFFFFFTMPRTITMMTSCALLVAALAVSAFGAALPAQKPVVWYIPADFCSVSGNSDAVVSGVKAKLLTAGLVDGRDYSSVAAAKHAGDANSIDVTIQPVTAFASSVVSGSPFVKTFCVATGVCASLTYVAGKPRSTACNCKPDAYAVYSTDAYGCSSCTCQPRPTASAPATTATAASTARPTTAAPTTAAPAASSGCAAFRDCNCKPGSYASYFRDANNCQACACLPGNAAPATQTPAALPPATTTTTTQAPAPSSSTSCVARTCNCKPGAGVVWSLDANNCRVCSCAPL